MKLEQVRTIARSQGLSPGKLAKAELIKAIQVAEGNFACFATACDAECDQVNCLWREDCLAAARQGGLS